jgi:antitoxin MazE
MQVARWGNSLAVRLPAAVVQALDLKDGENIEIEVAGERKLMVRREMTREQALQTFKDLSRPLPPGFKFNREEANER